MNSLSADSSQLKVSRVTNKLSALTFVTHLYQKITNSVMTYDLMALLWTSLGFGVWKIAGFEVYEFSC